MTTNFEQQITDAMNEVLQTAVNLDPRELAYYAYQLCAADLLNKPQLVPLLMDVARAQWKAANEEGCTDEADLYTLARVAMRTHDQRLGPRHDCSPRQEMVPDIKTAMVSQVVSKNKFSM